VVFKAKKTASKRVEMNNLKQFLLFFASFWAIPNQF